MNSNLLILAAVVLSIFLSPLAATAQDEGKIILDDGTADGFTILLENGSVVRINPDNGNLEAVPADPSVCSTTGDCSDVTVMVDEFSVPASIDEGGSFQTTLGSRGAFECQRSGLPGSNWDTDNFIPPFDGIFTVNLDTTAPGNYTLSYDCKNGPVRQEPVRTASIEVTEVATEPPPPSDLPPECTGWKNDDDPSNDLRPVNWSQDVTPIWESPAIGVDTWQEFFGLSFPATAKRILAIDQDQYTAFRFDASDLTPGGEAFVEFGDTGPGDGENGPFMVSISQCPGDFRSELGECRRSTENMVMTNDETTPLAKCIIPDSGTLYLNISFVPIPGEAEELFWGCNGSSPCTQLVE